MDKKVKLNMIMSLLLQLVTIISGFIIPRQILVAFGSNVNGLVNSITQFLNYISLIEGGLGSVLMTAMYKPLNEKNLGLLSSIVVAGNNFFKKIAKIFLVYLVLVSTIYPLIINTGFKYEYVCSLSLILGIGLFIQYYFSIIWRLLLQADRKVYVSAGVQIIVIVLNTILTIVAIRIYPSVHFVKLLAAIAFVIQPMVYNWYIKTNYDIDNKAIANKDALKNRWDGFGINLAAFFNSNTDVIVLTLLSTLSDVSIYGVYSLVVVGIKSLITSISAGITPSLGKEYALGNKSELNRLFSKYENMVLYFSFSIYSCAAMLIVPFVLNYTVGINDADYNQPIFSILLILSYWMFCLREPYVNMAYVANSYKNISKYAYMEAIINIVFSLIFVSIYKINGVALGTLVSMTFRTIIQIFYLKKNIIFREPRIFLIKLLIFILSSTVGIVLSYYFIGLPNRLGWVYWIYKGCLMAVVVFGINFLGGYSVSKIEKRF